MFARRPALAAATVSVLTLAACGSGTSGRGTGATTGENQAVGVVVGFYPLEFVAARIGGDRVRVTNLTRPGGHAHDVELAPKDVATVSKADLVVYEKAIQPAVDAAVDGESVEHRVEVGDVVQLEVVADQPTVDVADPADQHGPAGEEGHATGHEGHDHGDTADATAVDPHFWLDPVRYGAVAKAVADQLTTIDPAGKGTFEKNLASFSRELTTLDGEFRTGLASCRTKDLVTSHAAFAYLADRYGFHQVAISGLSPDQEPEPQRLAQVADFVKKNDVSTIYAETLGSPAVAQTVARETGAKMAVLDPIEGLTQEGSDYFGVMRRNLQALRAGQGCR